MKKVKFMGWECDVRLAEYNNGRIAIELTHPDDGPIAVASVNLPDEECEPGHTFIKDWSENAGMTEALVEAGIVEVITRVQVTEWVDAAYVKVLVSE